MPGKAKKILVLQPDTPMLEMVRLPLQEEGHTVIVVSTGQDGLTKARREQPDLVIVDFKLPDMKGNEFAHSLRKDPATSHQRIVMIADEHQLEKVEVGPGSSVDEFLIKPFGSVELVTKVTPLLISADDQKARLISTGSTELDGKMGGGVPQGSLTLIEGDSGAGKSVLAQQMVHGCLVDGYQLSFFTSENTVRSLVKQMRSLNLDIQEYLLLGKLRVFPVETSHLGNDAPTVLFNALKTEKKREMIFVDSLTSFIHSSTDKEVLGLFEDAKKLCGEKTTIILVVHAHALSRELITRLRSLCDAHLQLRTEEVGTKLVKTLEVTKVRGAEQTTGNIVSFEVEPGWGIRVIPINKVKG